MPNRVASVLLPALWTPLNLRPILWLDGEYSVTAPAAAIASMPDRAGRGAVIAQGTGANQPTYNTSGNIPRITGRGQQMA
jgi:hypothetical protein